MPVSLVLGCYVAVHPRGGPAAVAEDAGCGTPADHPVWVGELDPSWDRRGEYAHPLSLPDSDWLSMRRTGPIRASTVGWAEVMCPGAGVEASAEAND